MTTTSEKGADLGVVLASPRDGENVVQTWVRCVKMDGFVLIRNAGPDRMYISYRSNTITGTTCIPII